MRSFPRLLQYYMAPLRGAKPSTRFAIDMAPRWGAANLEMMIMSVYMFIGPIYEAAKKIMETNRMMLKVVDGSKPTL